jgi:MYXO-CTERM domain-containing protein
MSRWPLGALVLATTITLPAGAVIDGRPSDDPAVVRLIRAGKPACTGTVIAPGLLLTAAHCLRPTGAAAAGLAAVSGDGREAPVTAARVVPSFDSVTLDDDLAVLSVRPESFPVPPTEAVLGEPAGFAAGESVRFLGFGWMMLGVIAPGPQGEGRARIAAVTPSSLSLRPSPGRPCSGDSGGPVFAAREGRRYLVGVISSGAWDCGADSIATRTLAFAPFLDKARAEGLDAEPAGGCSSVPGPHRSASPAAMMLVVLLAGGLARRRSARV